MDGNTPAPTEIKLHQKSRLMELVFPDGSRFELSYELLRVYSPSAEVRGHGASKRYDPLVHKSESGSHDARSVMWAYQYRVP